MGVCWDATNSSVVEISQVDGSMRTVGGSGFPYLNSLARDDAGRLFAVGGATRDKLIRINPNNGAGTVVLTLNFGADPVDVRGLAFCEKTGALYAVNYRWTPGATSYDLYSINLVTGAGAKINDASLGRIQSIDFYSSILYGWDLDRGLVSIDTTNGAVTDLHPGVDFPPGIQGIIAGRDEVWAVGKATGENDKLYYINKRTGDYTLLGAAAGVFDVRGIDKTFAFYHSTLIAVCWSADNSRVVIIDRLTGNITPKGMSGFAHLNSLSACNGRGRYLTSIGGALKNQAIRIDPLTGAGRLVCEVAFPDAPADVRGVAYAPDWEGGIVAINSRTDLPNSTDLYYIDFTYDPAFITRVNNLQSPLPNVQSITFSPGGILYGWDIGSYGLIRIDSSTGAWTDVNPAIAGTVGIQSIAFAPDGALYGAGRLPGEFDKLYLIDKFTGAYSLVGEASSGFNVRGIEFIGTQVPPAGLNLLLLDR
jgi:hypothetical protein